MRIFFQRYLFVLILLNYGFAACGDNEDILNEQQILQHGEKLTLLFYHSKLDSLLDYIIDQNYKLSQIEDFRNKVETVLGDEQQVLNVQHGTQPHGHYYVRYSRFGLSDTPVRTMFTFNNDGGINQFSVDIMVHKKQMGYHNCQV